MKNTYRRKKLKNIIFRLLSVLTLILIFLLLFDAKTEPIVKTYSKTAAKNEASIIINDTVSKILTNENITYRSLVTIEKDSGGNIKAITSDIVSINLLKSEINSQISHAIEDRGEFDIKIPIGFIFGKNIFSGSGPQIGSKIKMAGNSKCEITNEFTSAGINQTLHRIMLNVDVELLIILPDEQSTVKFKTNIPIAETVIVGITPSSFGRILT